MFKRIKNRIKMWDFYLARYLEGSKIRYEATEPNTFTLQFNRVDFHNANSVFFNVKGYSTSVSFGFISELKEFVETISNNAVLNSIVRFEQYKIDWTSPVMEARLNSWRTRTESNNQSDGSPYTLIDAYDSLQTDAWLQESIKFLFLSEKDPNNVTINVGVILQLVNHNVSRQGLEDFTALCSALIDKARQLGVMIEPIKAELYSLLNEELPFNFQSTNRLNLFSKFIITNDILARNFKIRQGDVGTTGIYIATDIYSCRGIFKVFKQKAVSPEIIFVTGETGSGKSLLMKNLSVQLLSSEIYGTIDDVEGDEYIELADWVSAGGESAVCVNMRNSGFIDPVPIPDFFGDPEIDDTLRGQAFIYTKLMLNILIGKKVLESNEWIPIIVESLIEELYLSAGVTRDPSTWYNSKKLSIRDCTKILKHHIENKTILSDLEGLITTEAFLEHASLIYAKLKRYFEPTGAEYQFFRDAIDIDEINKSRLVILQYNLKSTSPNIVDSTHVQLMMLNSSLVSYQRSLYCKYKLKKYNFKIKDEVQRWLRYENAYDILNVDITGGRKMGDIVIFASNNPAALINSGSELEGIFTNITSFMIGAIKDSKVSRKLLERISAEHLINDLEKISQAHSVKKESGVVTNNPYEHGFIICLDKVETSVGKVLLPDSLLNSRLFKTGVQE